jgi:hypothetical protein
MVLCVRTLARVCLLAGVFFEVKAEAQGSVTTLLETVFLTRSALLCDGRCQTICRGQSTPAASGPVAIAVEGALAAARVAGMCEEGSLRLASARCMLASDTGALGSTIGELPPLLPLAASSLLTAALESSPPPLKSNVRVRHSEIVSSNL